MLILEILAGIILAGIVFLALCWLLVTIATDILRLKDVKYGPVGAEIIEAREAAAEKEDIR